MAAGLGRGNVSRERAWTTHRGVTAGRPRSSGYYQRDRPRSRPLPSPSRQIRRGASHGPCQPSAESLTRTLRPDNRHRRRRWRWWGCWGGAVPGLAARGTPEGTVAIQLGSIRSRAGSYVDLASGALVTGRSSSRSRSRSSRRGRLPRTARSSTGRGIVLGRRTAVRAACHDGALDGTHSSTAGVRSHVWSAARSGAA